MSALDDPVKKVKKPSDVWKIQHEAQILKELIKPSTVHGKNCAVLQQIMRGLWSNWQVTICFNFLLTQSKTISIHTELDRTMSLQKYALSSAINNKSLGLRFSSTLGKLKKVCVHSLDYPKSVHILVQACDPADFASTVDQPFRYWRLVFRLRKSNTKHTWKHTQPIICIQFNVIQELLFARVIAACLHFSWIFSQSSIHSHK